MELADLKKTYFLGLFLAITLFSLFFVIEYYLGLFIDYVYPFGYALLVICIIVVVPIITSVVDGLYKHYILNISEKKITLSYKYGVLLTLLYKTFCTLFFYLPYYVSLVLTFTLVPIVVGYISEKVVTHDD